MATRKTPEEMALARRLKVARAFVRLKYSLDADAELNGLLADITDDHNNELQTGGVKELGDGTLPDLIKSIADLPDDGVRPRVIDRKRFEVLPE